MVVTEPNSYAAVHSGGDVVCSALPVGGPCRRFPHPLTRGWRLNHATGYMIGCVLFLLGSLQYMPTVENLKLGGWLFTVGSAGFVYADVNEWWRNSRVGCCWDEDYFRSFESTQHHMFSVPGGSWLGDFQRAERGLNVALSVCGSILYFLGSLLFLPVEDALVSGLWVFVWGGMLVMVAQTWKVIRLLRAGGCSTSLGSAGGGTGFWGRSDWPAVATDSFGGIGAFCYLVGSVYLLPEFDISRHFTWIASYWFVAGGLSYVLSASTQYYRYFCTHHGEFSEEWCDWEGTLAANMETERETDTDRGPAGVGATADVELTNTTSPIFSIE